MEGLPFDAVAVDALYGRSFWLRQNMDQAGIEFYADVPADTRVYLSEPEIGIAQNKRGPKATEPRVLSPQPHRIDHLPGHPAVIWQSLTIRPTERGWLKADFARIPVWTVQDDMTVTKQWLLIRKEGKKHSFTFSNASSNTSLKVMALRKSQRYFIERDNQDAKSEFGWMKSRPLPTLPGNINSHLPFWPNGLLIRPVSNGKRNTSETQTYSRTMK
jgi:hypothetical protein